MRKLSLHQVNNLLFGAIVVVTSYIIIAPIVPQVAFWFESRKPAQRAVLEKAATQQTSKSQTAAVASQPNHLVIPAMLFDQPVLEGSLDKRYDLLNQGVWHYPAGSTPDKGGNTVFLAHRFSYTAPRGAFYFLNKVQINDHIGVYWNNKLYTYKVFTIRTVSASDTDVQEPTADARLTLYTCTPLWHPTERLVVVAKLEHTT